MFFRRETLLVSSIVVLVASMIADGTQNIFRRSLPRRLESRWVGCTSVSDAVGLAMKPRTATPTGASKIIATCVVNMDTLLAVAVCDVANQIALPVALPAATRTPTWFLRRRMAQPLRLPPSLLPAVLWMTLDGSRRILSTVPAPPPCPTETVAVRSHFRSLPGGAGCLRLRGSQSSGE